jgi:hypothetical protein
MSLFADDGDDDVGAFSKQSPNTVKTQEKEKKVGDPLFTAHFVRSFHNTDNFFAGGKSDKCVHCLNHKKRAKERQRGSVFPFLSPFFYSS